MLNHSIAFYANKGEPGESGQQGNQGERGVKVCIILGEISTTMNNIDLRYKSSPTGAGKSSRAFIQ